MTTDCTDLPEFAEPTPTLECIQLAWIVASIKREREINRRALLMQIDVLEREMGKSPTTAEIRERWRRTRGVCPHCGSEI